MNIKKTFNYIIVLHLSFVFRDLGKALRELKIQTERIARSHEEAGNSFQVLYNELNKYNDEQKVIKQQVLVM